MNNTITSKISKVLVAGTALAAVSGATLGLTSADAVTGAPAKQPVTSSVAAGNGWMVVGIGAPHAKRFDVVLVSPTGSQRVLTTVPASYSILDVSSNGKRVLFGTNQGDSGLDLAIWDAGTWRALHIANGDTARFTKPSGANLLVHTTSTNRQGYVKDVDVQRVDFTGRVQATFRGAVTDSFVQTVDGSQLIGTSSNGRVTVSDNATGRLQRTLARPAGYASCSPTHMWDASQVTVSCSKSNGGYNVFRAKVTGGNPVGVTTGLKSRGIESWGYLDAWSAPAGMFVAAVPPCGGAPVSMVRHGKVGKVLVGGEDSSAIGVSGNTVYGLIGSGCGDDNTSVKAIDGLTGTSVTVAGGQRNPGKTVYSVVVIDKRH